MENEIGDLKHAARSKYNARRRYKGDYARKKNVGQSEASGARHHGHAVDVNNLDRYYEKEEEDSSSAVPRKSKGADLEKWLEQYPVPEAEFYARQRVNLHEELGLPPAEPDSYQGLTLDLNALASCLESIPLHQLLNLSDNLYNKETGVGDYEQELKENQAAEPTSSETHNTDAHNIIDEVSHDEVLKETDQRAFNMGPMKNTLQELEIESLLQGEELAQNSALNESKVGMGLPNARTGVEESEDDAALDELLNLTAPNRSEPYRDSDRRTSAKEATGDSLDDFLANL